MDMIHHFRCSQTILYVFVLILLDFLILDVDGAVEFKRVSELTDSHLQTADSLVSSALLSSRYVLGHREKYLFACCRVSSCSMELVVRILKENMDPRMHNALGRNPQMNSLSLYVSLSASRPGQD